MLFDTKYDLVFGIGEACSCSQILRKCRLQFFSYPFDWLYGSDLLTRVSLLANNYEHFIDYEDLVDEGSTNLSKKNPCEIYKNIRNGIFFNHDFLCGKTLQEVYPQVIKKYKRRAERQIRQIESSENVLIVYVQTPNNTEKVEDSALIEAYTMLKNRFPNQNIRFLYFYCEHTNKNPLYEDIQNGLTKICFDYDGYNDEFKYMVNFESLIEIFRNIKITNRFITPKNYLRRLWFIINNKLSVKF